MPASPALLVAIGADGARGGWAAACLYADTPRRQDAARWETRVELFAGIGELAALRARHGERATVAIDVPIGLLDHAEPRPCDRAARARLGARRSSVFTPPARWMLQARDYAEIRAGVARRRARDPRTKGLSAQAAGIVPRIREVDAWVRAHPESERWLWEAHPELCFAIANGGAPMRAAKRTAEGAAERLRVVRELFPDAPGQIASAPWPRSRVRPDDLLDAYALLATAVRCASGSHELLGGERDALGVPMRMAA